MQAVTVPLIRQLIGKRVQVPTSRYFADQIGVVVDASRHSLTINFGTPEAPLLGVYSRDRNRFLARF